MIMLTYSIIVSILLWLMLLARMIRAFKDRFNDNGRDARWTIFGLPALFFTGVPLTLFLLIHIQLSFV